MIEVACLLALACLNGCVGPAFHTGASLSGNKGLQSGPMIGYEDMREVLIWVQAKGRTTVEVVYWDTAATASDDSAYFYTFNLSDYVTADLLLSDYSL